MCKQRVSLVLCALLVNGCLSTNSHHRQNAFVGDEGGSWNHETHLIRYGINFNVGLATFLRLLEANSVLEFGCGIGLYTDYLARRTDATTVYCLEPQPMVFKHSVFSRVNDITDRPAQLAVNVLDQGSVPSKIKTALDRQFDIVYSIEVLEHIPRHLHQAIVPWIAQRVRKFLVFSAAHPDQDGVGHIAERTVDDWRETWQAAGLHYQSGMTAAIRIMCDQRNINHRTNLLVFSRDQDLSLPLRNMTRRHIAQSDSVDKLWPELVHYVRTLRAKPRR
eukprot:TRINITY_DN9817_c0_g1_i1.p1 TRINITY_DN9817_c0_g1~~TRINITY_DN9817_c0_g1_i1.p1  ORF type:complete len:277 (+),score=28.89 TRINITY_DN9817_c0_g1_i1:120-950(+)